MEKQHVIDGVATETIWWMGERRKKLVRLEHESMSVNPFLLPLIHEIHRCERLDELIDFLVAGHLWVGYATGFGKLIDEKILPRVFRATKLDKAARKNPILNRPVFNEIDHIIKPMRGGPCKLLSLKAGRWTIPLTAASRLNSVFAELVRHRDSQALGDYTFDEIAVGVFYGAKETLTDKYAIIRGISRGADHGLEDLTAHVQVYAGRDFWAWLNGGEIQTQEWVLEGILKGVAAAKESIGSLADLQAAFRTEFGRQFRAFVKDDGAIDWPGIVRKVNG